MTQTALVTGATGFIGQLLVEELCSRGFSVRCFVRPTSQISKLEAFPVEFVVGDMTSTKDLAKAVRGVDYVFHLAALLKTPWSKDFERNNVRGAHNVAMACAQNETAPVLVVMSSIAASGPGAAEVPKAETAAAKPVSRYGRAKLNAENAVLRCADHIPISIIRPPGVFGPGDLSFLKLFRSVSRGWHVMPMLKDFSFSVVDVRDVVHATILAAERGERATSTPQSDADRGRGIYHIAHPEGLTFAGFGHKLAEIVGRKSVRVLRLPKGVTWLSAAVTQWQAQLRKRPSIWNLDKYREATGGSWLVDSSKAKAHLGFEPWSTLEEQLTTTARWYWEHDLLPRPE